MARKDIITNVATLIDQFALIGAKLTVWDEEAQSSEVIEIVAFERDSMGRNVKVLDTAGDVSIIEMAWKGQVNCIDSVSIPESPCNKGRRRLKRNDD